MSAEPSAHPPKRKRRSAERAERRREFAIKRELRAERTEAKNQAVRETLEPLAPGERPGPFTIGAIIAAVLAISAPVAYALGAEVNGEPPQLISIVAPVLLMGALAWGMWTVRYWAGLGFQGLLGLLMVAGAIGLVLATSIPQALANVVVVALSTYLFWRMVRALARVQKSTREQVSDDG